MLFRSQAVAVDGQHIWFTVNGGQNPTTDWKDIAGNLGTMTSEFDAVEVVNDGGRIVVVVGTKNGVYRMVVSDPAALFAAPDTAKWSRFGLGFPNVKITGLTFDKSDSLLVAGTQGRGAWSMSDARKWLFSADVLHIDTPNTNDEIVLRLTPIGVTVPRTLEVLVAGVSQIGRAHV